MRISRIKAEQVWMRMKKSNFLLLKIHLIEQENIHTGVFNAFPNAILSLPLYLSLSLSHILYEKNAIIESSYHFLIV